MVRRSLPAAVLVLGALVLAGVAIAGLAIAGAGTASAAAPRTPTLAPADTVIVGPTPDIVHLDAISIARDGSGALVYSQMVQGVAHVFVSRLLDGSFQAPQEVDAGLAGASSQPVIAAGQGGLLLVAFVNGGTVYVAQVADAASPLTAPTALVPDAINPSLSLSTFGKGYLAFTDVSGTVDAVRTAFYNLGQWTVDPTALNADPGQSAGAEAGRPQAVACGDGIGIVAWGENGHIYTRRLSGATPSVVFQQADMPFVDGAAELSASDPVISSGGDSSYASVAFEEQVSSGAGEQTRVVMDHLHAGAYDGLFQADGLAAGAAEGADQPQTAVTEYGGGWVTSEHQLSHQLWGGQLGVDEAGLGVQRIDSSPNTAPPDAVPATAGVTSTLIAWQQTPGLSGPAEIRVRYAADGSDLGPEQVISSPALGPADADSGLVAAGDVVGDAAIAWVQGTGAGQQIVAAQLYQSPGSFVPLYTFRYARSPLPVLSWSPAAESWGLPDYAVDFDGAPIATTYGTDVRTPALVANGRHTWEVTATNQAGLTTVAHAATVFVDTIAPKVAVRLSGRAIVRLPERIAITDSDPPPPGAPAGAASGIASAQLRWGDGTKVRVGRSPATHAYRRAGAYTVTVTVTDRAGNRTVVTHRLRIKPKPKPKKKKKKKKAKQRQARAAGAGR